MGQSARGFPSLGESFFLEKDLEVRDDSTEDAVYGGDVAAVEEFGNGGSLELGVCALSKSGSGRVDREKGEGTYGAFGTADACVVSHL